MINYNDLENFSNENISIEVFSLIKIEKLIKIIFFFKNFN